MKTTLLGIVGLVVFAIVGQAIAADTPAAPAVKAPIVATTYNWTGVHIGVNAGYGFGGDNSVHLAPLSSNFVPVFSAGGVAKPSALQPNGVLGGGQVGYDFQFNRLLLVGLEADFQGANIQDSRKAHMVAPGGGFLPERTIVAQRLRWFGTVRPRFGVLPMDRLLFYATGGLAYGDQDLKAAISFTDSEVYARSKSSIQAGWTVGGGLEWAFWDKWSVKTEYLYYDLGDKTIHLTTRIGVPNGVALATFETKGHLVRAGLNYKF